MSRNASGTHSLPAGNPVVTGTAISSTVQNATMSDLSTEITDSLSRSGKGGMTAPLRCADGSVSAPAHSFTSETGTGFYRAAAGDLRASVLGVDRFTLTATAAALTKPLAMGANKITGLADGTAGTDAVAFGQLGVAAAMTPGTDWTAVGGITPVCVKSGIIVVAYAGYSATVGAASFSDIVTLPAGHRPASTRYVYATMYNGATTRTFNATLSSAGVLALVSLADGSAVPAIAGGNIVYFSLCFSV